MGVTAMNVTLSAHAQAAPGSDSVDIHFHHQNNGIDESHNIPISSWGICKAAIRAGDRSAFEAEIQSVVSPSFGWTAEAADATWRAVVVMAG